MKSRNRGFTLTELIAVIALIAILSLIATTSFINIRQNILHKNYENLVAYIETKAEQYAASTGVTYVSVDTLIKEGFIEADDETSSLYNPENNEKLNCYYVNIVYNNGSYEAKLDSQASECKESDNKSTIYIWTCKIDGTNCREISDDEWFTENVLLTVMDSNGIPLNNAKYEWHNNLGFSSTDSTITTTFSTGSTGKVTYYVTARYKASDQDVVGSGTITLNFDTAKPIIAGVNIENKDVWASEKKVTITASDSSKVGISTYYFGINSECGLNQAFNTNVYTVTSSGTYYVCVKDNNNFYSNAYKIDITKIDNKAPTIKFVDDVKDKDYITLEVGTNKELQDFVDVSDNGGSGVKRLDIIVNNKSITNVNELTVDEFDEKFYFVTYKAYDYVNNLSEATLTLKIVVEPIEK
jgi:prepilin-type N-terminal cleavage/methylation domain-containing protein